MPPDLATDEVMARVMVDATAAAARVCRTAAAIVTDALAFDAARQRGDEGIPDYMEAMRAALRHLEVYHYNASPLQADHCLTDYAVRMASVLLERGSQVPTTAEDARTVLPELHRLLIGRAQRWRS